MCAELNIHSAEFGPVTRLDRLSDRRNSFVRTLGGERHVLAYEHIESHHSRL